MLANIYLHHVIDQWAERWRRHEATGDMIIVRYADDIIVGFEHETDARHFLEAMRERLEKFALSLHPDKTRLIEFGRYAADGALGVGLANRRVLASWASPSSVANPARVSSSSNGRPGATASRRSCERSNRKCGGACISRSPHRGNGCSRSSAATSTITPCRRTVARSTRSVTLSLKSGNSRCGDAARSTA